MTNHGYLIFKFLLALHKLGFHVVKLNLHWNTLIDLQCQPIIFLRQLFNLHPQTVVVDSQVLQRLLQRVQTVKTTTSILRKFYHSCQQTRLSPTAIVAILGITK